MRYLSAHYVFPVSSPPLKKGIVCVGNNGVIVDIIDTGGKLEEREKCEFYNGILTPGFVNAHCHLELSHLRNCIKPRRGLSDFITSVGRFRASCDYAIAEQAKEADNEMLRNGIVAVGDVSNRTDSLPVKKESRLFYHTFVEIFGLDACRAENILSRAQSIENTFRTNGLHASIVPHAMYSVSDALFDLLGNHHAAHPGIVSMHHQEHEEEISMYVQGEGMLIETFRKNGFLSGHDTVRPDMVSSMEQCLSQAQQCLLVHNTHVDGYDMYQRNESIKNIFWVLCPGSNLYIQNRLPDLYLFTNNGMKVCLGTDSLASNTGLSILDEMKIIHRHHPGIPLGQLLQWATLNGARALGIDHVIGSLEKNKKPGVNLITDIDYEQMQITGTSEVEVLV